MKRYETYKDSGVQWIGEIPNHWKITNIGRIFQIKAGGDAKPELYSDVKDEIHPFPVYTNTKNPNDIYAYTSQPLFEGNTITVTGRGEIGLAIYRDTPYDAIIRLLSLKPKLNIASKYHMYFINAVIPFTSDSAAIGQLSAVQLSPKPVCIPSLAEQEIIVTFLDEKTAEIDELVSKVEREIELLKEYKQAEIARVVTKGLNPNAPMKPSGISWIGEIPQHWDVKRLWAAFTENRKLNNELECTEAFKFNYGALVRKDEDRELTEEDFETYKKYTIIKPNDILINGLNLNYDFISQRVAISYEEGIITSAYLALTPRDGVNPMYYCYLLKSMDAMKLFHGMGTGIRLTLSYAELRKQPILFPPLEEQQKIVDYINRKTTEIDSLVVELTYQVEYLKEYKQRLIADVVTGKINVQPE